MCLATGPGFTPTGRDARTKGETIGRSRVSFRSCFRPVACAGPGQGAGPEHPGQCIKAGCTSPAAPGSGAAKVRSEIPS